MVEDCPVDVVIVSYNTRDLICACVASVQGGGGPGSRIIVVDNASEDGTVEAVRAAFPDVTVIPMGRNAGFGAANNRGFRSGTSEFVLFLNPDTEVRESAIPTLVKFLLDRPGCVAVGPRVLYPDGSFHPSCRRFPSVLRNLWQVTGFEARMHGRGGGMDNWLSEAEHIPGRQVDMVSGCCFLVRRSYLDEVGGFDEGLFLYEEEMDLFLPARRSGRAVCYCGEAEVVHHHGASSGEHGESEFAAFHMFRSKYYCFRKHYGACLAWSVYACDQGVYGASAWLNRLRGTASPAPRKQALSRRAYQDLKKGDPEV